MKDGNIVRTICGTIFAAAIALSAAGEDFSKWVDPFVGTVGDGNCFPGACRPFGMVQPNPDTSEKVHCGGYKFDDETIRGFSQTHLNGTGRPAMGDVSILPVAESKLKVESEKFKVKRGERATGNGERLGNVVLNGKKVDGVKISHEDIMRGGLLEF